MHVVNIGCFLLPVRFSLSGIFGGAQEIVCAQLRTAFSDFDVVEDALQSELLLDYHRSTGAQQMETILFSGAIDLPEVGAVRLYVSSLSVGFVVVDHLVDDNLTANLEDPGRRDAFKASEGPLSAAMAPLVADWSRRIADAVDSSVLQPRPSAAMQDSRLLWWHRVAVQPPQGCEFPAAKTYGVRVNLAGDVTCEVGNGFTNLYGACQDVLPDVLQGLMIATQEWLVVDEAKRLIADHLLGLSRSRDAGLLSVDEQYGRVLQLTEEVALRNLILNEELRYLANARSRVRTAACECWGTSVEAADLENRATALRDLFGLHRERIANNRDDRRNRYIFVFTALTLIQASLVWYDFLTEDDVTVANQPRPWIALTVLVITTLVLLTVTLWSPLTALAKRRGTRGAPDPGANASGGAPDPALIGAPRSVPPGAPAPTAGPSGPQRQRSDSESVR